MRFPWLPLALLLACGADPGLRMTSGSDWHAFVRDGSGGPVGSDVGSMRFRAGVCDADELRPEYARLDETSITRFLERKRIDARIERPRADLMYVNIGGAGTEKPIRLRVAILANADEAGRELHQGILQ